MIMDSPNRVAEAELRSGEQLLWTGKPNPFRMLRKNLMRSVIGLIWTGFVLVMINFAGGFFSSFGGFSASSSSFSTMFTLILGVFLLIGIGMILSPLWDYFKATRTVYAITDQRAVIITQLFSTSVNSYSESDIEFIQRNTHGDGTGDIIFRREQRVRSGSGSTMQVGGTHITFGSSHRGYHGPRYYMVDIGFFGIPNSREVEDRMLSTFRRATD